MHRIGFRLHGLHRPRSRPSSLHQLAQERQAERQCSGDEQDGRGRTAQTEEGDHIRDLIEQVLFTSPGERVNRPDFGCGLMQFVFAPNNEELATATQYLVQGALQRWLGELIQVQAVDVTSDDSTMQVTVQYIIKRNQESQTAQFSREV